MKPLSYRQVRDALLELTEEQLDMTASVLLEDEVIPIYQTILFCELPDELQEEVDLEECHPLLSCTKE